MSIEAMKQALDLSTPKIREMVTRHAAAIDPRATLEDMPEALAFQIDMARALLREFAAIQQAEVQQPAVGERLMGQVSLPDGSAFAIASFPLPKAHWLYAPREYATGAEEPLELPTPILTHDQREAVVAAIRYAVRGATMCGREQDFDPDAMVQNAVYALCGPYARVSAENTQASVNLALSQQPATTDPVGQVSDLFPSVRNKLHAKGFDSDAPLYTHPAPGVPDGYALVPIEPTDEMMAEMLGPFIAPFIAINDDNRSAFIEAYPRMLTAAQAQKGQP